LDTVKQVSTIDALLAGAYDGEMTLRELLRHGDFGIGTFHALDGEMIVYAGRVYQVRADGRVVRPPPELTTPFAAVTRFAPEWRIPVARRTDWAGLRGLVDGAGINSNLMQAVFVRGDFAAVHTRSVPAQTKPYPPLAEVTRQQPEFHATNVTGVLVGFRLPAYMGGINVPGYHLHFLSDDAAFGGHLLDCVLEQGVVEIDQAHRFIMVLPSSGGLFGQVDLSVDRSAELLKVEH
ncbi:MAG: acetolactate decarboxylase, partial [Kiritimatiellia bacterium]